MKKKKTKKKPWTIFIRKHPFIGAVIFVFIIILLYALLTMGIWARKSMAPSVHPINPASTPENPDPPGFFYNG